VFEQVQTQASTQLAACLLLAGGLKPSPLAASAGVSVLDLSLRPGCSVLSFWLDRFRELGSESATPSIHIVCGSSTPKPSEAAARDRGMPLLHTADTQDFRGPAGAAKDACSSYPPEAMLLIAEAARYVNGSLVPMLAEHARSGADVTVASNPDNSPAGVFIIRCRTLSLVPPIGFMDLKEQWLGKVLEAGLAVRVYRLPGFCSYELRTREDFLAAAGVTGGLVNTTLPHSADVIGNGNSAGVQRWDDGVEVGAGAAIVNSVVMAGCRIGAAAVVARSVLCPLAQVPAGAVVVDAVIPPAGVAGLTRRQEIRR
jgi:hypothetical protein